MTHHLPPRDEPPPEPSPLTEALTSLPVTAQTRQMTPAEPVYDGEVMDDLPRAVRRTIAHRFVTWWGRSRYVPAALTSRHALSQTAKDMTVWVIRSPGRFIGAVSRGIVVAARG